TGIPRTTYGDSTGDPIIWSSASSAIAHAAEGGMLVGGAPGTTTITGTAGKAKATFTVTALPGAASLVITPANPTAKQGDVIQFTAVAKDRAGKAIEGVSPTWSFSPGHGELGADGSFVAYEAGQYVVTGLIGGVSAVANVTVTARDVRRKTTVVGQVVRSKFETSEVWIHPNGKVAYLGTTGGGDRLYSIDISDPTKPTIVDSVQDDLRVLNDI